MENFVITASQIQNIYSSSYTIGESRGKKRQHIINETIIESLKSLPKYQGCEFKCEKKIVKIIWGKYFNVDVAVYNNGTLIEILLFKAPASNISQNSVNLLNAKMGEVMRLLPQIKEGVNLTFISLQPNITPYFTSDGNVKHTEKNHVHTIQNVKEYLKDIDFSEITVTFNIEGIENCKTKKDVKNLFSNNEVITNIEVHI
jgi:hypothetical protein